MQKAFSLIELLIYMALLGMFLIVMTNVLVTALQSQSESISTSLVDIDSRFILWRLAYDVSHADSITIPASAGATASTLGLSSGSYALTGTNLQFAGIQLNSYDSQISNFSVKRVGNGTGNDTVIIDFTVSSEGLSRAYTTTLGLR